MANTSQTAVKSAADEMGRKRTKPTPDEGTVQITFRLDVDLVRQIDAEAERIGRENHGVVVGRTDLLRSLVVEALKRLNKRK